ncbi:MerR family transcriptional regulator [[Clostridium] sordellii]|uniref:MerR family transcriptional regulator n=3 Tax=Paraclostridium sordellii TaxID=1505 RepID=A0A0C7PXW8_PARSO|nr:MerR family transcriptional regulator [Paeniclostridium sordellii]QYE97037.1 MerR family transcriptional regulator [Paeniclostridium sordellii]CEN22288.1 MerR family transcriptional regulator [[Clostridium] sordellii] [Paeniclostridium sordellii]CEN79042.1 MerR family transcriptional regulator [[Clostridium] sordellii] [Paeniclostridium sordellii]CEP88639.1 MerR family transcriptional regulator [[Clostridium] sordellii] [Paeniclostridium sordellii]CEP96880.1 MerR family transcriptional regu
MGKYLSIGQMAKLNNISVQTLRHYEKVELLKPSYTNEDTGYRYYSLKDFSTIDLIKQCKAMGMSLEEIKEVTNNYTSLDSISNILNNQKQIIDEKIKELENIKNKIEYMSNTLSISLEKGINKVFLKQNKERLFIKYNYTDRYTDEFEINLRKVLLEVERDYENVNAEIAFTTSYKDMNDNEEVIYKNVMINLGEEIFFEDDKLVKVPAGNYLTMYFDDAYRNSSKYYHTIMNYIQKNNIKTIGDFHEIYIMTRVGMDGKIKSLGQIEILIDK